MSEDKEVFNDTHVEIWKKARDSAEHFDKMLGDFRKIAFAIDAAFLPILLQVYLEGHKKNATFEWQSFSLFLCLAFNLVNYGIWLLEKHYHLYLAVSASVAANLERTMKIPEELQITNQYAKAKKLKQFGLCGLHVYDWIYIIPGAAGLFMATLMSENNIWPIVILAVIELVLTFVVIGKQAAAEPNIGN